MSILDLVFPKYCVSCRKFGSYLCADCFSFVSFNTKRVCLVCQRPALYGFTHPGCLKTYAIDGAFASLSYNAIIKKLLYTFKYKPYVADLQHLLATFFFEGIIQDEGFQSALQKDSSAFLVPIPLHPTRLRQRGYNQAVLLAKILSHKLALPMLDVLMRCEKTTTQVGLGREERRRNIRRAFVLKANIQEIVEGKTVFLVDDVMTTGSTLREAANVLKRNGAQKVWGITLAQG